MQGHPVLNECLLGAMIYGSLLWYSVARNNRKPSFLFHTLSCLLAWPLVVFIAASSMLFSIAMAIWLVGVFGTVFILLVLALLAFIFSPI